MTGFVFSSEFGRAVDTLMKMAEVIGLQGGYAVFDPDLTLVDWYKEEWHADEVIGAGSCKAAVPDIADTRHYAEAALLAGLTYTLVNDQDMAEYGFDGHPVDVSRWVEGKRRVEHHLFGATVSRAWNLTETVA